MWLLSERYLARIGQQKDALIAQFHRQARERVLNRKKSEKDLVSYPANLELLKGGPKSSGSKKAGKDKRFYVDYDEN